MIRLLSENFHRNNCLSPFPFIATWTIIFFFFFYSKYPSVICSKIFQWPLNYLFRWSLLSTWLLRLLVTWTSGFALLPPLRKILHFLVLNFVQVTLGPVCVCLSPSLLHTPDPLIAACFTSFKEPFTPLPRSLSKLLNKTVDLLYCLLIRISCSIGNSLLAGITCLPYCILVLNYNIEY